MLNLTFFLILKLEPFIVRVSYQFGACGRTRTDTILLSLDFESNASTNFTTQAIKLIIAHFKIKINTFMNINYKTK